VDAVIPEAVKADPRSTLVVVGFAEALAAPEVVWSLVEAGCTVVAFSRDGVPAALAHSRHASVHRIPAPETDAQASLSALVNLLQGLRADGRFRNYAVLPLDDAALWLCSRAAAEAGWTFAGPGSPEALDLALDKELQVDAARAAGVAVPGTVIARIPADLDSPPFPFPIILRPSTATRVTGGRLAKGKNWICSDAQELAAARASWKGSGPLLVQPYIRGIGVGVFGFATGAGVRFWSAHRRVRMMNPHGSGSSACVSIAVPDSLKEPIGVLLQSVGWRGLFMVELLQAPDGSLHFVELNGRAWGSMALARRQGLEYPAWTVQQALGEAPAMAGAKIRAREGMVCRNIGRELMHLLFVLRGPRSKAVRDWPSFWSSLRAVLSPNSDGTVYNWRRDDWRVFASDCYYTILRNTLKT
jgi:predicted ATP-grasp superfamily ATP-dependent carboligase